MTYLQVKYCMTEDELNNFLKFRQRVHNIQYLPKVYGDEIEKKDHVCDDSNSITSETHVGCDIVAIVSYFVDDTVTTIE